MSLHAYELTRQQLRLVLGERACSQIAVVCENEISVAALERAFEEIIRRHEALRTVFVEYEELEQPRQIVQPGQPSSFCSVRLDAAGELQRQVEDVAATERAAVTRRAERPGIRLAMLLRGDFVAAFIASVPASQADAVSMLNIVQEIDGILSKRSEPASSTQYLHYAEWQSGLLETSEALEGKAFWQGEVDALSACEAGTTLPGRETPPKGFGWHRETSFSIDRDLLEPLARRLEVNLQDVLVGIWAICLWRTANCSSVAFAVSHDARCFPELKGSVGAFAQHLPLAISLEPAMRASAYFRKLHARLLLLDEQHPFVETLGTNREPVAVNARIAFEWVDLAEVGLTSLKIPPGGLFGTAGEELKLLCTLSKKAIHIGVQYDPGYYSDAFCGQMLDRLKAISSDLARVPDAALVNIDATPVELRATIGRAARATTEPKFRSLVEHVHRHGALRPDALAVVGEDGQLSYGGLVRQISRVAEELRARGAQRDSVVAIILPSSIDLVPSMLAAWHIGAAFSVINVQWPEERIAEVLETLRPAVVICRSGQKGAFGGRALDFRGAVSGPASWVISVPQQLHPHQLAYVVFTSATSGPPKGVMVEHRQMYDYSVAIGERLDFRALDHFLAVTTFSADLAYTMLFPSLLVGGCLHIASRVHAIDAAWLGSYIERWGIDFLKTVPSHLMALLAHPHSSALMPRKQLILGGEAAPLALLKRIRGARFVNHYGPAETAVGVFAQDPESSHESSTAVPLGRELAHVYTYLQALGQQIAPPDVAGELIIGGHSVTRGYLGRPGATAEKFRPDEHSGRAGERVYETGDLARRSPDGEIHFIGRKDGQLKVRGYRVETREVAEVLTSHPAIHHAHVCLSRAEPQQGGEKATLSAYAVVDPLFLESVRESQYRQWSENWRKVFESAYAEPSGEQNSLAANSWKSSYTGEPMSERDVQEQVDAICEKIRSWKPRTILEIGCGTGMLLLNLAPHCERYVGTDFSSAILNDTRRVIAGAGLEDRVELLECEAHELEVLGDAKFNVILLNSVIQYFADTEYFERVMRLAQLRLTEVGRIFLGDVRDRRLLECLHASVAHFRSAPGQPAAKWASRVRQRIELDSELCFEPQYFLALADRLEHIRHAEITLKRGFCQNELVRFRFDVTLFNHPPAEAPTPLVQREWDGQLRLDGEAAVLFRSIPNARLVGPAWLATQLENVDPIGEVKELSLALKELEAGVEPEDLSKKGHEHGYEIQLRPSLDRLDRFDALFIKPGAGALRPHRVPEFDELYRRVPATDSVSSPLLKQLAQSLGGELKDLLKSRLPEYMVPSAVVLVSHLPVTLNGKLDSSRLPRVGHSRFASDQEFVETRDAIERTIARTWEEILGVDRVGATDDFFALGGHSLLATEVVAQLQAVFQVRIPLASFFGASPTVRGVAKVIIENEKERGQAMRIAELWEQVHSMSEEEVDAKLERAPEPATPEVSRVAVSALSDAQRRVLRECPGDAANAAYNNSVLLRLKGRVDVGRLRTALNAVVMRHEAWRTVFQSEGGVWSQRILDRVEITLALRELAGPVESSEARLVQQAGLDEGEHFDMGAGPLIRAVLYQLNAEDHALLVVAHHLVCDGWTVRLAVAEIAKLYAGRGGEGRAVGYRELLKRQEEWLRGAEAEAQKKYWARALEGFRPLELGPGLDAQAASNAARESKVPLQEEVVTRLFALARQEGVSVFGIYLAALYVALVNHTGELDITIGTPMHNRVDPRDSHVFGCCVNLQPIRMNFGSVRAPAETIKQVWEVCRLAQQNQSLCVLSHVLGEATSRLNIVYELLEGELEHEIELGGLEVSVVPMSRSRTRHNVHVVVRTGASPAVSILYRESRYDAELISSLARAYEKTLRDFALLANAG